MMVKVKRSGFLLSTLLLELKIQELQQLLELLMEEKIRRSLKEPVQAFPRYLAEKAGTRTKNRNEAGGEGEARRKH